MNHKVKGNINIPQSKRKLKQVSKWSNRRVKKLTAKMGTSGKTYLYTSLLVLKRNGKNTPLLKIRLR